APRALVVARNGQITLTPIGLPTTPWVHGVLLVVGDSSRDTVSDKLSVGRRRVVTRPIWARSDLEGYGARIARRNVPVTRVAPPARRGSTCHRAIALLGTLPDEEVARRTERTVGAVRQKREELGIPNSDSNRWLPRACCAAGHNTG